MLKALMWKEWREQRALVLAGILAASLMPFFLVAGSSLMPRPLGIKDLAEVLPAFYIALLWPLFAAAAGAGTISGELGDGTLGFLLSRPVSRSRVWWVKVLLGGLSFLAVAVVTLVVAWVLFVVGGRTWGSRAWEDVGAGFAAVSVAGIMFLLFSCAVFFSALLSRTMTAAAAGLVTALTILSGIYMLWFRMDLIPRLEPQWIGLEIGLAGGLVLLASYWVFSRGEMLRGRGSRRTALVAGAGALGGLALFTLPVLFASVRLPVEEAELWDPRLNASGNALITTAAGERGHSAQVWLIPTDGTPVKALTGRLTFSPAFSPDGEWIAYLSARGALGLRRSGPPEVRVIRPDGSGDRRLDAYSHHLDHRHYTPHDAPDLVFSPAGDRLLLADWSQTVQIYSLEGGPVVAAELRGTPLEDAYPIGWNSDGTGVILFRPTRDPGAVGALGVFVVRTGQVRLLFETERSSYSPSWTGRWLSRAPVIDGAIPLVLRSFEEESALGPGRAVSHHELVLVDLEDGALRPVTRSQCLPFLSADGERGILAYVTCPSVDEDARVVELRRRDVTSGEDRVLATVDYKVQSLLLSPAADSLVVRHMEGTVLVDASGVIEEIGPDRWFPMGWSGRDRLVVRDTTGSRERITVVSLADGSVRAVFP